MAALSYPTINNFSVGTMVFVGVIIEVRVQFLSGHYMEAWFIIIVS